MLDMKNRCVLDAELEPLLVLLAGGGDVQRGDDYALQMLRGMEASSEWRFPGRSKWTCRGLVPLL